jgi:hypothetical protein
LRLLPYIIWGYRPVAPRLTRRYNARLECELLGIFLGFSSPGQEVLPRVFRKEEKGVTPYEASNCCSSLSVASVGINKLSVVNVKRSNLQLVHMGPSLRLNILVQIIPL